MGDDVDSCYISLECGPCFFLNIFLGLMSIVANGAIEHNYYSYYLQYLSICYFSLTLETCIVNLASRD